VNEEPTQTVNAEPGTSRPGAPKVHVTSVEPRIFGVVPPALALVLGIAALVAGLVLLISGTAPTGVGLAVFGLIFIALAIDAARGWPTSALPRIAVRAADGAGARLGLARVSTAAWAQASREMIAMRRELRAHRDERETRQSALGAAAYREDDEEMDGLRQRLAELDEEIERTQQAIRAASERARTRVERERSAVKPTEQFAVVEDEPPPDEDATTRTAPTARRRSHSAQRG
jgi:hypothetical protein